MAQTHLGLLYEEGNGIDQNYKLAFRWYRKAAKGGNMYAMYCLGLMYENGNGVVRDYTEAFNW